MRLGKDRIRSLCHSLVEKLESGKYIERKTDSVAIIKRLEQIITDELALEDRLNEEVERILKSYDAEFSNGRVDYHRMFQLTKKQLAKEKGIIL